MFVVDDDASVVRAVERLLRSSGFVVETFTSPASFLERLPYEGVACVVLDMRMLNLSGLDVQRAIAGKAPRCQPCSSAARAMSLPQRQRCETARSISW